jgi:hypothetical protein
MYAHTNEHTHVSITQLRRMWCGCPVLLSFAGYRAAGDSALLQQLCAAAGMPTRVVELVGAAEPGAVGVVSSSKVSTLGNVSSSSSSSSRSQHSTALSFLVVAMTSVLRLMRASCPQVGCVASVGEIQWRTVGLTTAAGPACNKRLSRLGSCASYLLALRMSRSSFTCLVLGLKCCSMRPPAADP